MNTTATGSSVRLSNFVYRFTHHGLINNKSMRYLFRGFAEGKFGIPVEGIVPSNYGNFWRVFTYTRKTEIKLYLIFSKSGCVLEMQGFPANYDLTTAIVLVECEIIYHAASTFMIKVYLSTFLRPFNLILKTQVLFCPLSLSPNIQPSLNRCSPTNKHEPLLWSVQVYLIIVGQTILWHEYSRNRLKPDYKKLLVKRSKPS